MDAAAFLASAAPEPAASTPGLRGAPPLRPRASAAEAAGPAGAPAMLAAAGGLAAAAAAARRAARGAARAGARRRLAAAGAAPPARRLASLGASGASAAAPRRGAAASPVACGSGVAAVEAPVATAGHVVGEKKHGWTCLREEYIKEFSCTGYLLEHDRTGAQLMSMVQPADENKTFGVVFRTPPENSNGIAHVLEHSVLCGSRKYPVKEPFVELMKSSLQTFLNAMTFPDRTCYPVASCNLQDFYNLVDVYLDAVLHPRAVSDPRVLAQEGWHYEIEKKDDPLVYKGVVFNEMKGVYSSPDSTHNSLGMRSLFPDSTYGVDSGGDPKVIPSLDFDYFKSFHSKYYHPSNAKFWFYGDDPAERRLELLDGFLSEFDRIDVDSSIGKQPLFEAPKKVTGEFAAGEDEDISKKNMVSINWLLADRKLDLQSSLALSFLNYLLMGTPAAPLYKALVDSGLGSRVIGGGLYDGLLQPIFGVGLKDLQAEDGSKVEELVLATLRGIVENGFQDDEVQAAINTIEFRNRELNTGSFPKGLALMFASVENWNYGGDPFEPLRFEEPLASLKERLARGEKVFEDLIQERLLDNNHRVVVESVPSKEYGKQQDEAEKAELAAHRETLDDAAIEALIEETKTLKEIQETPDSPEAMEKVPRLSLDDIPTESPKIPTEATGSKPTTLVHALPTSGVVYVDVAFSLDTVPEELLPLLPLFAGALRQLGTAKGDFVSLTRRVDRLTGGISTQTICLNKRGEPKPEMYLMMRGKSMASQVPDLAALMEEIALTVNLDNQERFVQLVKQSKSGAQSGIVSSGHVVAGARLSAQTSQAGWVNDKWSGVTQYQYLSSLLAEIEGGGWDAVSARLKRLQACVFNQAACSVLNLTADAGSIPAAQATIEAFASGLPETADELVVLAPKLERFAEGIIVPTQVNYVGKGGNLYEAGYKLHGSSLVVSKLLGTTYLWDRVRVSGGAYGGFCRFDPRSGDFKYLSYRDPNLEGTLQNYDGAPQFLKELELGEDELAKAIIGCMGDVDAYMLPDAKGYQAMLRFLLGEGDDYRQQLRDEILSTTTKDFGAFAGALDSVKEGGISVVGSKEAIDRAQGEYDLSTVSPFAA